MTSLSSASSPGGPTSSSGAGTGPMLVGPSEHELILIIDDECFVPLHESYSEGVSVLVERCSAPRRGGSMQGQGGGQEQGEGQGQGQAPPPRVSHVADCPPSSLEQEGASLARASTLSCVCTCALRVSPRWEADLLRSWTVEASASPALSGRRDSARFPLRAAAAGKGLGGRAGLNP